MQIKIRLFAAARSALDQETVTVELPEGSNVSQLREVLVSAHPELAAILSHSRFAIDQDYATDETLILPSADLAIIPPVSGG